jgi:hypothetical protein
MAELQNTTLRRNSTLRNYYRLEGNSTDTMGATNGTDTNVSYGVAYGKYGQGVHFNGSNTTKIVLTGLTMPAAHSFFCWFNADSLTPTNASCLFNDTLQVYTSNKNVSMWMGSANRTSSTVISTGIWYHTGYTLSGSTQILYVNGVAEYTESSSTLSWQTNPQLGSRADDSTTNYRLTGKMDEVAIFTKALSATEVMGLYNSGGIFIS